LRYFSWDVYAYNKLQIICLCYYLKCYENLLNEKFYYENDIMNDATVL